jgi:hypothetical protein
MRLQLPIALIAIWRDPALTNSHARPLISQMIRKRQKPSAPTLPAAAVTLRYVDTDSAGEVARLAALDSARLPRGPWLVADVEGRALAALGLRDGELVADPYRRTAELRSLLELRADQLQVRERGRGRMRARAVPRPSPALAPVAPAGFLLAPREHG